MKKIFGLIVTFIMIVTMIIFSSIKASAALSTPYVIDEDGISVVIGNGYSLVVEDGREEFTTKVKYKNSSGGYTYLDLDPTESGTQTEVSKQVNIYGGAQDAKVDSIDITINGGDVTEVVTKG